jgi:drug/metabolite transporter (DMT)-like permease
LTVLYVALGTSVAAYVLWYWVIKYLPASRVAVFHNLQPLFATAIATVWLGEDIGLSFILGGLVVLGGVVMAEI